MTPLALHALHAADGARFDSLGGKELVEGFPQGLSAEVAAARSQAGLFDLSAREWLRVEGDDRASFLHGMVTNDVKGLPEGGVAYAALLTPKGAMVADARIWKLEKALLVETEPGQGEPVRAFLDKYLISEDATLTPDPTLALLSLTGPQTREALAHALPARADAAAGVAQRAVFEGATVWVAPSHLAGVEGADLLVPVEALAALYARLKEKAQPVGFAAWEVLRVEAGVPRYGADLDATTIPLEANLERAISYDKGCYIGQEVIARATFRGHVNRKLCGLLLGPVAPPVRSEARKGERKVGVVTSVVASPTHGQHLGLAFVHRDSLAPGTVLDVAGRPATVVALPFQT